MDTILIILRALKIDQTVLIQFGLLFVFYNIFAPVFFNRLKEVLELREKKTTKLHGNALALNKKSEELELGLKTRLDKTHAELGARLAKEKHELVSKRNESLALKMDAIQKEYEASRTKLLADVKLKKETAQKELQSLSSGLIEKLTK